MSGGIGCELALRKKNVGTDSFCPYGTSRLLTQFQALRTWLLSFCPYGTGRFLRHIPGSKLPGYLQSVPPGRYLPTGLPMNDFTSWLSKLGANCYFSR
jgi:hypothetical protein